ncbi:peptidoglycan-binding protein [Phytohabitans flavus]|uniref:peptidoglycan-binding protein n=1 Tax=Phytohabitans flavus TaxID=1076124 RepID=UPI0036439F55
MRRAFGAAAAVTLAAAGIATGYAVVTQPRAASSTDPVPTGTAPVTRGSVSQRVRIPGTYGFDGSYSVVHQGPLGILTRAAAPGSTVDRGAELYTVDGRPARLLFGATPAYRAFESGMTDGPDVKQLERNLVELGLDPRRRITVDNHFSAATAAAIRRWETAWGVPAGRRTGALALGQVVFLPGALRVGEAAATVGTAVGPNQPVLAATSTTRVVTAPVTADRQGSVKVGDPVTVTLPGAKPLDGTVLRIGRVATTPQETGDGRPAGPATVTVVITVPRGAPDLDQAPAQVSIATAVREDVLLVPIAALLAKPGGGYRLRLSTGAYADVDPGIFGDATGKVEVAGGLTVGDLVEVPE